MKKQNKDRQSYFFSIVLEVYDSNKENEITMEQVKEKADKGLFSYWFAIKHDKDTKNDNELDREHIHLQVRTAKQKRKSTLLNDLVKLFDIEENRVSVRYTENEILAIQYLRHQNDENKFQYAPFEVITNREDLYNDISKRELTDSIHLTSDRLIDIIKQERGNKLKILGRIGLINYRINKQVIDMILEELEMQITKESAISTIRNLNELAKEERERTTRELQKIKKEIIQEREKLTREINEEAIKLLNKKKKRK